MGSTFMGLNIGYSGLSAYQGALNVTANNISNVKTDGYSRQVTNRSASEALRSYTSYGMVGTGVQVNNIAQQRDIYYDVKYWNNNTLKGEHSTKGYYMKQIESYYYYEEEANGINYMLSKMSTSLEDLLINPSDLSTRNSYIHSAQGLADQMNEYAIALERMQEECNSQIGIQVDKINNIARQISVLNKQINTVELTGVTANSLRDQRALLIDELSEIVGVEVEETTLPSNMKDSYGEMIETGATCYRVTIGGQTLVSDFDYYELKTVPREEPLNQSDAEGLYDIVWADGRDFNMCNEKLGGTLQGLIQMRDGNNCENLQGKILSADPATDTVVIKADFEITIGTMITPGEGKLTLNYHEYTYDSFTYDETTGEYTFHLKEDLTQEHADRIRDQQGWVGNSVDYMGIPYYMSQLNEFARCYAKAINDIHMQGQDLNGNQAGLFFTGTDLMGVEFKLDGGNGASGSTDTYYRITAKNFRVREDLLRDPSLLSTSRDMGVDVEKTDILQEIKNLESQKIISLFTPGEFFETMLSDISISAKAADTATTNYETIANVIKNQRLSVSGVDEDEEALDLIKYQNAYNLNSKVISIMNELYDKLINETGV